MVKKIKAKKRGVKPGTKQGRYKKQKTYRIKIPKDYLEVDGPVYTPAPILTLCGQLEDAIMLLETRVSNAIAKIISLM